jgi:hypothetical protein
MWYMLHTKLLCLVLDFKISSKACKNKFNNLYIKYKVAKVGNDLSRSNQKTYLYYDNFYQWYDDFGAMVKRANASTSGTKYDIPSESEL